MKAAISTTEATRRPTIVVLPQPSSLPRISASTRQNRAPLKVTTPAQSTRETDSGRYSRSRREAVTAVANPIGTFTKKIHSHPRCSVSTPPTSGPDGHGGADGGAPDAERGAPVRALELLGQQGGSAGEHHSPADALEAAGEVERGGRAGQAAEQRRDREKDEADDEHALAAEEVGQGTGGEEHRREHQRIGVHHPLQVGEAGVQLALDVRQRDVHHRDVEQQHERRQADGEKRPALGRVHGG